MKRQDVSGQNTLHVDASGGGPTTDVNIAQVGGTPVTSPLPVQTQSGSTTAVTGNVTVVQPTGTNLHVVTDTGSTTAVTGTVTTASAKSATATLSNVAGNASSVTLLASNASRLGATITNDSTAILYVKFGASASTSSYVVRLPSNAYYEVPFSYTGLIAGIWDSATGNARVTEMT